MIVYPLRVSALGLGSVSPGSKRVGGHEDRAQDVPRLPGQGGFHGVQVATSLFSGWLLNFLEKGSVAVLVLQL